MPTPIPFADDGGTRAYANLETWCTPAPRPPGAIIALTGIAALAALIRRHTGMEVGLALYLIAVVGLVVLVWVVFAPVVLALIVGG